jgi:hypothetical protein
MPNRYSPRSRAIAALLLAWGFAAVLPALASASVVSLESHDDGWIDAANPFRNHGAARELRVGRSPERVAYLRFVVTGLSPVPSHVALRLRALSSSGRSGIDLRSVTRRGWREMHLTWRSAPRRSKVVRHHRRFDRGWIAFDVTGLVRHDGIYAFALTTRGDRTVSLAADESGQTRAPRLIIDEATPEVPESRPGQAPASPPAPRGGTTSRPAVMQPPGFSPLSDAEAASRVRQARENRPANVTANHTGPAAEQLATFYSASREPYSSIVTGAFTGTTDEIIQWAAWKWGIDEDVMRAVAVQESDWKQPAIGVDRVTFGIFQVKTELASEGGWPGTYPLAQNATAFNADYYGRALRSCYDGREAWLRGSYRSGDLWGCVGWWFSGDWHDAGAEDYVSHVKRWLAARPWANPSY